MRRVLSRIILACVLCLCCSLGLAEARSLMAVGGTVVAVDDAKRAGEVVVVLNEEFMNALLEAILEQPAPPKFPLAKGEAKGGKCASEITLVRESEGRRTAVVFAGGRVGTLVAFRGTYEAPLVGCLNFEGWADTVFNLAFDHERQAFEARVEVRDVKLKEIPSMLSGSVTGLVQEAIDRRVNPIQILRAEQLGARLPLRQGSALQLRAREVKHEVVGKELRLRIVYEIVGAS